jgi:hypothetical protein
MGTMVGAMPLPLWSVALVLAAIAPLAAKALASLFERLSHDKSRRLLSRRAESNGTS